MQLGHVFSHFQQSKLIGIGACHLFPRRFLDQFNQFVCMLFWYGQIFSKRPEFCLYLIDTAIHQIWQGDSINN